jgi:hypothetical protein
VYKTQLASKDKKLREMAALQVPLNMTTTTTTTTSP